MTLSAMKALTIAAENHGESSLDLTVETVSGTTELGVLPAGGSRVYLIDTHSPQLPAMSVKVIATAPDGTSRSYAIPYAGSKRKQG